MNTNELSDRKLKILSMLAVLIIGWLLWNGVTSGRAQVAPANQSSQLQEIVKLTQAKMSDDVILAYIKNSGASYNLSADDILYLNNRGVSQPVISALLQAKSTGTPSSVAVVTPTTPAPPVSQAQVSPYPVQAAASAPPTAPLLGSDINLGYFQTELAPYGTWVAIPGQGVCWVPSVELTVLDWRPYFNEGYWVYTDDGWSWQSDYPWGEYVFHYGRWTRVAPYGWVWVPGYDWGPAWVSWRHAEGEGYCGWAPLPPGARFEVGVGLMWDGRVAVDADFGLAPDLYVFIPFDHFWAHDYVGFRAPFGRVPFLFRASVLDNHFNIIGGRFVCEGIGRERVGRLTHHEVRAERIEFHDPHVAHAREVERSRFSDFHGNRHDVHGNGRDDSRGGRDHGF